MTEPLDDVQHLLAVQVGAVEQLQCRLHELVLHDVEVGNEHVRGRASDGMLGPSSDRHRVEHCEHAARAEERGNDLHSRGPKRILPDLW